MTTISAAALNDAVAWLLMICAVARASSTSSEAMGWMFFCIISYAVFLFTLVRVGLHRLVRHAEDTYDAAIADHHLFALVLIGTVFSGWMSTMFGLSALIGAFLFGVIVPRKTRLHAACLFNMEEFVNTHFLPLYFALSGLRTDFTTLNIEKDLPIIFMVCIAATLGKMLGAGIPALMYGFKLREAAVIAMLMNTRGLLELIMLNIGIQSGILNPRVFSVMVIMCMFTTITAFPIVQCIYPEHFRAQAAAKAAASASPQSLTTTSRTRSLSAGDGENSSTAHDCEMGIEMVESPGRNASPRSSDDTRGSPPRSRLDCCYCEGKSLFQCVEEGKQIDRLELL